MKPVNFVTSFFTLFADTLETNKILRETAQNGKIYQESKTDMVPYAISLGLLILITLVILVKK